MPYVGNLVLAAQADCLVIEGSTKLVTENIQSLKLLIKQSIYEFGNANITNR